MFLGLQFISACTTSISLQLTIVSIPIHSYLTLQQLILLLFLLFYPLVTLIIHKTYNQSGHFCITTTTRDYIIHFPPRISWYWIVSFHSLRFAWHLYFWLHPLCVNPNWKHNQKLLNGMALSWSQWKFFCMTRIWSPIALHLLLLPSCLLSLFPFSFFFDRCCSPWPPLWHNISRSLSLQFLEQCCTRRQNEASGDLPLGPRVRHK